MFTVALFDEEEIHEDLHLMIVESPDESQTVVYGEEYVSLMCLYTTVHVLYLVEEISG